MNEHKTKFLQDYQPSVFLIDQVNLYIELGEAEAIVTSQLSMRANPKAEKLLNNLVLDGEDLTLLSLKINDVILTSSEYQLDSDSLTLFEVPEAFLLEIKTKIFPQQNGSLSGLYQSNKLFCTQCEAEGFRRITYFLDRPDVLSKYTTTIAADKNAYPVLLSNGELIDSGEMSDNLHWFKWEDPHPKPCYLFAMVAGQLDYIEDHFRTQSGKQVTLRIFCEPGDRKKCYYAMSALKKAMRWDEEKYGREYDLSLFMIVTVHDFNFGAMENKGLNIFNAKYILANPETATDSDYSNIDGIVGHEYFHNWSGNRVTCRDWFQICLKEGFTVYREQAFVEEIGSRAVHRIDEVGRLRDSQFPEDAGPLAHPIRPESYIEIDNFYTTTVYRKGAEVIRMLKTLLGNVGFRQGTDLYFARYDGFAVTCEDFITVMEEANGVDLSQFRLWYQQAGTPTLFLASKYYPEEKEWHLAYSQTCPPTPGQETKLPMQIPLSIGLLDAEGKEMALTLADNKNRLCNEKTIDLHKEEGLVVFVDIDEKPVPSLLRGFSAPVIVEYQYRDAELAFLMTHDSDSFMRWEASQIYALRILNELIKNRCNKQALNLPEDYFSAFDRVLCNDRLDKALVAKMLELPSEQFIGVRQLEIDVDNNHAVRRFMLKVLAKAFQAKFKAVYEMNSIEKPYEYNVTDSAKRRLKNICLSYLTLLEDSESFELAFKQYKNADNMTDKLAVLYAMNNSVERQQILDLFYNEWSHEPLVLDKWFSVQAVSSLLETLSQVKKLMQHPKFNIKNPNRVYALLGNFSRHNPVRFHDISGEGYRLLADKVIEIDQFNPQVASRLLEPLTHWKRYDNARQALMFAELTRILARPNLSKAVYEIANKCRAD